MYQETTTPTMILRIADGLYIPRDVGNRDYQEFLVWEANGGVIVPYVTPPLTPEQLARQAQVAQFSNPAEASDQRLNALVTLLQIS